MTLGTGLRRVACVLLALTALVTIGVLAARTPAQAWPVEERFSISVSGTAGSSFFSPRNASITVDQTWDGSDELVTVRVTSDGTPLYTFEFATQEDRGGRLRTGYYRWAQRYPFNDSGRPGIGVYGEMPCNDHTGSFEVRDIRRDDAQITSLWLVFERWCGAGDVEFGELRLGYADAAYDVSPRVVVWPWTTTYPGRPSYAVPIVVHRTSAQAVTVDEPSVSGPDAADFPIRGSSCTGSLTRAGCVVWVGFTPSAPGPRHARLTVPTSAGPTFVSLDATGALGFSDWTVDVDWEDPQRADEHLVMTDSASVGSPYEIRSQAWEPQPDGSKVPWNVRFGTYGGLVMRNGDHHTYEPDQNPFYLDLSRSNNACSMTSGAVDLDDLAWLGPDRQLDRMDAQLTAVCTSGASYSVTARMRFHARADVTAPGRVSDLQAVRDGGRVGLTWTNPSEADVAGVVVRWYAGGTAPSVPWAGNSAYQGPGTSTSFPASPRRPVSVAVWTYDGTGNVGRRSTVTLP